MRDRRLLDTLDRRGDEYRYYSSIGFDMHHDHHRYDPYKSSDMGYFLNEFTKEKPPTFDADVNLEDAKAWIIGMKKFFELQYEYTDNMNAKNVIFSLKGKEDI